MSIINPDAKASRVELKTAPQDLDSFCIPNCEAQCKTMEKDHSIKTTQSKGASISHSSGGKIPYPKHVWSPAGGWYAQPANWKMNTAICGVVIIGLTAVAWNISAEREFRHKMPEKGRFFPSRYWSKQIIEYERAEAAREAAEEAAKAAAKGQ